MTAKYTRAEHLLWIVPIIHGLIAHYSTYSEIILVYYNNAFILFSFFNITAIFLSFLIVPFLIQSVIRKLDLRNTIIAISHIVLSLTLLIGITFIFSVNPSINIDWQSDYNGELSTFIKWSYYNEMCITLFNIFIGLQFVYCIYGSKVLISNYILSKKPAITQHEYESELAMQMAG